MEPGEALPRLCDLLADQSLNEFTRVQIIWRMDEHPDNRAVPALLRAIKKDPSGSVVRHAINALALCPCKLSIACLIDLLDQKLDRYQGFKDANQPDDLHDAAVESLRTPTGECFGPDSTRWRTWWETQGKLDKRFQ